MKHPSTIKKGYKNWKLYTCIVSCLILPAIGFSQPSPPGPGGGSPDTPLGVPFSDNMNLLLLLAGVVFAVVILKRIQNKKTNNSQPIIDHN
jgi:hypothetical protein